MSRPSPTPGPFERGSSPRWLIVTGMIIIGLVVVALIAIVVVFVSFTIHTATGGDVSALAGAAS